MAPAAISSPNFSLFPAGFFLCGLQLYETTRPLVYLVPRRESGATWFFACQARSPELSPFPWTWFRDRPGLLLRTLLGQFLNGTFIVNIRVVVVERRVATLAQNRCGGRWLKRGEKS